MDAPEKIASAANMGKMIGLLGIALLIVVLLVQAFVVRRNIDFYFSVDKATRESDQTGGPYVEAWRTVEARARVINSPEYMEWFWICI